MENVTVKTVFLLGAIGAGKSTVLSLFRLLGATVLSADSVVHDLYQSDAELIARIRAHFGSVQADDGSVDRGLLALHLASHPEDVLKIEEIVHPKVRDRLAEAVDGASGEIFVYELPISRPTTDFTLADAIVLIDAPDELRLERIQARGLTREEAEQRIKLHPKPYIPEHKPVFMIINDGDKANLESQATSTWKAIIGD